MRKSLTALLALALVAGAFAAPAAEAKKKKKKPKRVERTVEAAYETPVIGVAGLASLCSPPNGCANFSVAQQEQYIKVDVVDSSGTEVLFSMSQDVDGDGSGNIFYRGCGSTGEAVPITAGLELRVSVYEGGGAASSGPCVGVASRGTITATFSNLP